MPGLRDLIRLALRRDRVFLPVWLGFLAFAVVITGSSYKGLYNTPKSRADVVHGLGNTAATLALYGRIYADSVGGLVAWRLGGISLALVGLMSILIVVRHTRADEESGRAELIGAGVVDRRAPLTAALLVAAGANVVLGVIVAAALAALGIERAHLVGHSLGGAVALELAAVHPGLAANVTLIASAALGPEINAEFIDGFVKMERRREAQDVLRLLVHDPELVSRTMVEDVLRYKRLDGVAAALAKIAGACFPDGRQAPDRTAALIGLTMPVQVIWGRDDRIVPAAHAEALQGRVPVHILDNAGHLPQMEKAAEVNRLIAAFIGV